MAERGDDRGNGITRRNRETENRTKKTKHCFSVLLCYSVSLCDPVPSVSSVRYTVMKLALGASCEPPERRGLALPGIFGVFYYRSANPRTLGALNGFLPVPIDGLTREFADGATPDEVCARTIRALMDAGARHF